MHDDIVNHLMALLSERGNSAYGEHVTQLQHALQCATLAAAEGASAPLVVVALLHDLGHLLHKNAAAALASGQDDRHEVLGARYLQRWFGEDVTQPIALHVEAKRYLCFADPSYMARLSEVSQKTLALQGSVMSAEQAAAFLQVPFAPDAIRVRQWDEEGKRPQCSTPSLEHFGAAVRACLVC